MSILEESIVVDGCAFAEGEFPGYTEVMDSAQINAVILTVPFSNEGFTRACQGMVSIYNNLDTSRQSLISKGFAGALGDSKVVIIPAFQDPCPIENDLGLLRLFYELGVRVVQLTYNKANYIGSGCTESTDRGLTDFGRKLVKEMNRLGMVIDLSHCGSRTALEALELSQQPVIFSHANVRNLSDNPRNRTDEEIKLLARKGGVIGLTPWGPACWHKKINSQPTLDDYLAHVDYIVDLVGIDHVGFGSDNTLDLSQDMGGSREQALLYPEVVAEFDQRVGSTHEVRYARGFSSLKELGNVIEGLRKKGYQDQDIKKFLGGNFVRVLKKIMG